MSLHPTCRGAWLVGLALSLAGCVATGPETHAPAEAKPVGEGKDDNAWFKAKSGQDLINTYYWADYYWAGQHRSEGLEALPPELQSCVQRKNPADAAKTLPLWGYANCWMAGHEYDSCRFTAIQGRREETISECRDLPLEIYLYDPKVLKTFAGLGDKTSIELQDAIQDEIKKFPREDAP